MHSNTCLQFWVFRRQLRDSTPLGNWTLTPLTTELRQAIQSLFRIDTTIGTMFSCVLVNGVTYHNQAYQRTKCRISYSVAFIDNDAIKCGFILFFLICVPSLLLSSLPSYPLSSTVTLQNCLFCSKALFQLSLVLPQLLSMSLICWISISEYLLMATSTQPNPLTNQYYYFIVHECITILNVIKLLLLYTSTSSGRPCWLLQLQLLSRWPALCVEILNENRFPSFGYIFVGKQGTCSPCELL